MTDRWQRVEKLCQSALELKESQRGAFLDRACAGDEELRREVESLLKFDGRGNQFIEQPALEVAARMMAQEKPESLLGQQLGSYQIISLLGAGGMGVVYKARDTRLNRFVAIKVLPPDRVSDPDRKRRFIQEAKAASALNHPNIITIYDIGSEGGIDFIAMEYVAGKTLDQEIPRKGMRVNEALKPAIQMADALAKAHAAGIIHRDLKPSNVMVTDEGLVKILDFGLAKLTEVSEKGGEGTRTLQSETQEGMIIGTLSYMSPEQAEGKKVDARSDIFSFGSVLYEMVTGQKAFEEDSKMSTLAAIASKNPKPAIEIKPSIPGDLDRIVNHCLRKDPARRFQDMADLKVELEELRDKFDSGTPAPTPAAAPPARRIWRWVGTAIVVVAMVFAVWLFHRPTSKPAPMPEVVPLTTYAGFEQSPSFSPDGNQVVFSWNGEKQDNLNIYVKLIGSPVPLRLTAGPSNDRSPMFSPDGRSIGFVRTSKGRATFIVIPAIGGPERNVVELTIPPDVVYGPGSLFGWLPDAKWVVTDGLALISTESGEMRSLTSPPTKLLPDFSPAVSPDGHMVAFSRSTAIDISELYLLELTDDLKPKAEPRRLTRLGGYSFGPAWTPNGQEIIFTSEALGTSPSLWKVPVSGVPGPQQLPLQIEGPSFPAISRSGNRLVCQRETRNINVWRLALSERGIATNLPAQFISSTRYQASPQYSPDGKHIAFESDRSGLHGIWICDADGSNFVELFLRPGASGGDPRWSPDGQRIAFTFNLDGKYSIYVMKASGGQPTRLTTDSAYDRTPSWSRDGSWVCFASLRTGRWEVWKVSAGGGAAVQLTHNGGAVPFESPDGKGIYYTKGFGSLGLWKIPVNGGEESREVPYVGGDAFGVADGGIYFASRQDANMQYSIQFLSFATGKVRSVAPMLAPPNEGLSVSPDGRFLLFSQVDQVGSDLMLVENFR